MVQSFRQLCFAVQDVVVMPPGHDMFTGKKHPLFEELCLARMKEICNCTTIYNVQVRVASYVTQVHCLSR